MGDTSFLVCCALIGQIHFHVLLRNKTLKLKLYISMRLLHDVFDTAHSLFRLVRSLLAKQLSSFLSETKNMAVVNLDQ